MKFKKSIIIDILILVVPLAVMFLLKPVLPDKVPIRWNLEGACGFIDKKYSFVLGLIPFVLYELIKIKYRRK